MKTQTMFIADDGTPFDNEEDARRVDAVMAAIKLADAALGEVRDDTDFLNGDGYYQWNRKQVDAFLEKSVEAIRLECGDKLAGMFKSNPSGFVGRYLDDGDFQTYSLWCRYGQIDGELREWGQAFYALNPGKGKYTCLNP